MVPIWMPCVPRSLDDDVMERDADEADEIGADEADATRRSHTRARWKKLRAATLVLLLLHRRAHHGSRHNKQQHKRMPTSVFFAKPSVQAATAAAAQRLATSQPLPSHWFTQKRQLFERLTRKPMQSRDDVDIKLLGDFLRQTKFFHDLSSASIDALAQTMHFRTCHEGEVLHLQGSEILDTSGRYLVVSGSLLVYKNSQFALRACEGEDYVEWFLTNVPGATREGIRYGDCIETCSTGDITGDDATLGYLFREHSVISQVKTVIAYVTQADYKRVVRFNVDNEAKLLDTVREILTPPKVSKQNQQQGRARDPTQASVTSHADLSRQQVRLLMRFLLRFKCFRVLPEQFCMDIITKMQLSTVTSDEVLCTSSDDQPWMVMVLDGKLCVHVRQSYESQHLKSCDDGRADKRPGSVSKALSSETTEFLSGCEAGRTVEASIGTRSLHVCSLLAGDAFGELAISSALAQIQGATIYHPYTTTGHMSATVVRISRHDYMTALQRYIETTDFNLAKVCSILSRSLPQDRTDEQVQYMKTFLLHRSSAKLFFGQLPSRVLDGILLNASVESRGTEEDIGQFFQKEGSTVVSMKVVLNGYVGVFKDNGNMVTPSTEKRTPDPAPKRAVLRRYQSRLIRANTHVLDTSDVKQSGRRASIQRSANVPLKSEIPEFGSDEGPVDPVSVLPSGAAFGHLQILTGQSKSPYSYAAFASGSGVFDDSVVATSTDQSVHLLSIPAPYVHLYLASLDGTILYNPVRAFRRLQHEHRLIGKGDTASTFRRLQLPLLLMRNSLLSGIPRRVASSMIEEMDIVRADARHVIYEVGEPIHRALFVVLSGSVRVFSYASKGKPGRDRKGSFHPVSDEKRPKFPRRISQEGSEPRQKELVAYGESSYHFLKPASDSIFLSDYSQTTELVCGDVFGSNEQHSFAKARVGTSPVRQSKPQAVHAENVVSMTASLIGVVTRRERQCELSSADRSLLLRIIDDRDEMRTSCADDDTLAPAGSFDSLSTSLQVLETMDLSHRLSTSDRLLLANHLKYMKLAPGETVFRQGEAAEALYFVLFGNVTLYISGHHDCINEPRTRSFDPTDHGSALIEVMEGEVFGEEVFDCSHGCTRRCTAVATIEDLRETVLVYLSRSDFEMIVDRKTNITGSHRPAESKKDMFPRLLGLDQREVSVNERWKMAIHQVIQLRAQRSQWPTVLTKARNHRIDLLHDLIKDLPAFEGTPAHVSKNLCRNAILQTFAQDTVIYSKTEAIVHTCFLVIQGSVTLYQTYYGSVVANSSASGTSAANPVGDNTSDRVTIQVIEPGEIFGEFELLDDHPRRHINAIVGAPGTRIVIIQQEDFFAYWPERERNERKLNVLKAQLRDLCRVDPDQLCSLYYGMKEYVYRRNEVIIGNKEQDGYLHVIQDGVCVVHDVVVLKQTKSTSVVGNRSPMKLSLDTRVSALGPGAILLADRHEISTVVESRRGSSRSLDCADTLAPLESPKTTQYVVVDSPTMTTYCVQLFPRQMAISLRQPDLLVVLLLGKSGLSVIRGVIEMQLRWRAENIAHAGRLVADSLTKSVDRVSEFAKGSVRIESDLHALVPKPVLQKDITSALLQRDSGNQSPRSNTNPHKPTPPSPRQPFTTPQVSPHQSTTFGSFSPRRRHQLNQAVVREFVPASSSPPILPSLVVPTSPRVLRDEAPANRPYDFDEQLRKEESVLVSLPKPRPRDEALTKLRHQEMRRRHGRPLPKRVENSGEFVDEHSVSPTALLKQEHERKKASLCRRLLHVKGATQR